MPSLKDLLEETAARHDPHDQIQKILDAVTGVQTQFGSLALVVDGFGKDIAALKLAVQSIQQFLGAPDPTLSAEDQAALDAVAKNTSDLAQETSDLQQQAGSINTNQ